MSGAEELNKGYGKEATLTPKEQRHKRRQRNSKNPDIWREWDYSGPDWGREMLNEKSYLEQAKMALVRWEQELRDLERELGIGAK